MDKTDNNLFARLEEGATLDEKTADEVNSFLKKTFLYQHQYTHRRLIYAGAW